MNLIQKALALTFILLPLQFALNPYENVDLALIRVVILAACVLFIIFALHKRSLFIPLSWHCALFTLFAMYLPFSLFYSPETMWTLRKILFLFSFFPLYYILISLFQKNKGSHITLYQSVVYGAVIASTIGIAQFFMQFFISLHVTLSLWSLLTPFFLGGTFSTAVSTYNSWLVNIGGHDIMRAVGFFPDPHMFSFYLGLIIPLSFGLYAKTAKKRWLTFSILLICANLLTFSRGGYVAILMGCISGMILLWPKMRTSTQHLFIAFIFSITLLFLIPHNPFTQRFISSFDTTDTSNTHRIFLWKQACEEITKRPLFGTGLGAYPAIINPTADYRMPIYAHNLFLDITTELGLIGLLFFISIFMHALHLFYKNRSDYLALFAIISLCTFLTHAFFDTPLFSVHTLPVLIFIFALATHYESPQHKLQ